MTLAASLVPTLRAMRVPPLVAIREGAANPVATGRPVVTITLLALGVGTLVTAIAIGGLSVTVRLVLLAAGALALMLAVAGASRWAVPVLASGIERPLEPFARVAGELAREDTVRNPSRTAVTAAALTVGVALIAFVAVVAQGLRQSTDNSIRHQLRADYVIAPPE